MLFLNFTPIYHCHLAAHGETDGRTADAIICLIEFCGHPMRMEPLSDLPVILVTEK